MRDPFRVGAAWVLTLVFTAAAAVHARQEPSRTPPKPADTPASPKGLTIPSVPIPPPPPPPEVPDDRGMLPYLATTDQAIRLYEARVQRVPNDYLGYRSLGEVCLRKARESGDASYYERAEAALRKSLAIFPDAPRAQTALAIALCGRHRFAEAIALTRSVYERNPRDIDNLATLSDALLEIGRYAEAESKLEELHRLTAVPEVLARLANLAELKGDPDAAAHWLHQAIAGVRKLTQDPKALAWYYGRLGEVALAQGRIAAAEAAYCEVDPQTDSIHDATFGLAQVRLAQGRTDEALTLFQKAVAIGPDPHMLAALGDLYVRLGHPEKAEPLFQKLIQETEGLAEERRALAMFYADHDRELPKALELAQADLAERQDIYAYDTLAWALLKNHRPDEAARAIAEALKLKTKDARLHFHAGMIYRQRGEVDQARDALRRALHINPHFGILQAEQARATLAELDAAASVKPAPPPAAPPR